MLALLPRILIAQRTMGSIDHGPITVAFHNETDAAHYKTYGVFFRGDHCYARATSKRRGSTDASTLTNSHSRHAAAAANQGAYTAPVPNILRQNTPITNARNAKRIRNTRATTYSASTTMETTQQMTGLPDVDETKGTAQGRRTYATKTTTRRSQQALDKPSGPRETGEGVAEAAQDEKYGPGRRREHQRQWSSSYRIQCLKGRKGYSQNPYRLPS